MTEKVYPNGIRIFPKNQNTSEFVKGKVIITLNELVTFCKENEDFLTEYNGQKQLKCDLLEGNKGLYMVVDTWKPEGNQEHRMEKPASKESDNLSTEIPEGNLPEDDGGALWWLRLMKATSRFKMEVF
jgi:hypothetical protein